MKINDVKSGNQTINPDPKVETAFNQLQRLIDLLNQREIPEAVAVKLNYEISQLNTTIRIGTSLRSLLKTTQSKVLKFVEKDLKIVPLNYYRNLWLVLGMTVFGLPIGVAIGMSVGNIGLLGIGLLIGMALGLAVRATMDKKAKQEGRHLDLEIK